MTDVHYPYAEGDLLAEPHTYFYSEYRGREFLDAWARQRDALLRALPEAADPPPGGDRVPALAGDVVETDVLLDHVYAAVNSGREGEADVRAALLWLVRKFGVTKRVHGAYGPGFRAVDRADHKAPGRYLRLAEVFEAAYAATGELPCLNAMVKCMDTLSILSDRLAGDEGARLARLIERECGHVRALADKVGVAL